MNSRRLCLLLPVLLLLGVGCEHDPAVAPEATSTDDLASTWVDPALAADQIVAMSGWEYAEGVARPVIPADKCDPVILSVERESLLHGIAHYTILLQVGPGAFDRIALHRVVKEQNPRRPIRTAKTLFLQHGDAVGFLKFLYGTYAPSVPDDHSVAIYLAQRNIDVWGIDQNWVLVPGDVTDFTFMREWDMDNQIENLRTGLAVARATRLLTGSGHGKMNLLGYSAGGALGYAYLNDETTRPPAARHVSGFVCADMVYKYSAEEEAFRVWTCNDVATYEPMWEAGLYQNTITFRDLGYLAETDPDGPSPFVPGLTNLQAALFLAGTTYQVWLVNDWWHYFGAYVGDDGMPTDLRFVSIANMTDFMQLASPFETLRFCLDYEVVQCDEVDVPWDDHLAEIQVPVLYIGPAGGIGESGHHTLSLLGSTDVEILSPSLLGPDQRNEDFGHIDIFTAPQAPHLVWQPLHQWIVQHSNRDDGPAYPLAAGDVE